MHLPPFPPVLRTLPRLLVSIVVVGYFALGLLVLVLRHAVLPNIDAYRGDIEQALSRALGQSVAMRAIDARWQGLRPSLRIHGLEIRDAEGRPALGFEEVEADIAWSSLWRLAPHFARLEINAPALDLRRDRAGRLFVAGLEVKSAPSGAGFSEWLLAQDRIVIRRASVTWTDELRAAPPLVLPRLDFDLRNGFGHHRFGLVAEPPKALAARLDVRGDFRGRDLETLAELTGEAYLELDHADLAGWHAWVDYPFELPRGKGSLRLWLNLAHKEFVGASADMRLTDTTLRLAPELPMLETERVEGRLAARHFEGGYALTARHLTLATRDGIRVEPTDLDLTWRPGTGTSPPRGEATANGLDAGALAALAGYLPFEAGARRKLAGFGPEGRLRDLKFSWTGDIEAPVTYSAHARFEDLGLRAQGVFPGFAGFDGSVDGNEKGGTLDLQTRGAVLDLPAVFEQSKMALAVLDAKVDWTVEAGGLDVYLRKARFENGDAAGEASGRYRGSAAALGDIDLSAKLTRAAGGAVSRYMPLVVGAGVRGWLRDAIAGGAATATLRLKGDLNRFPFRDGSGIFEIKGPFHGAALRYAADWPGFDDVAGDLEFVGARMLIRAQHARLWGVQLADVKAEIVDLEAAQPQLVVTGMARGPTADFLRFVEDSPVGERIEHVTQDMKAAGNGELRLRLDMPLQRIADTEVDGRYRLLGNTLNYDPDMPPLADINGELHFSGDQLDAKKIRATLLGAPLTVDVATEQGRVTVKAAGTMSVAALRQRYDSPLFEHLSGSAPWSGAIRVRGRTAEARIESSLQGIASSLPEPFNKTAASTLPLVLERKPPDEATGKGRPAASRDQMAASLGDAVRMQLLRRHEQGRGGKVVVEQGLIAVGRPDAKLPERGVRLAAKAARLDLDFWRRLLANGSEGRNGAAGAGDAGGVEGGLPVSEIDLRADELLAFGRAIDGLQLTGRLDGEIWKMDVQSHEAAGRIEWNGQGKGRLSGRLTRLDIPESATAQETAPAEPTENLPAIDLVADRFSLHGKELGELRVDAENTGAVWNARFGLRNDDGELAGKGRWHTRTPAAPALTYIDFKLTAKSVEGLLRRLGYSGVVRHGRATLEGELSWGGAPTGIDYASLAGKLAVQAENGQFNKLEPGVGRLLGVLSLQSLPRRISLDFRDIFSEGFAFDSITGQTAVEHGVMTTSDLQIRGPAAKVLMNGSVDLGRETQDLKVRVQPTLGETVATGVLLVNPAIGAAAWLMNKVFGNPLDKAFAFDYAVTGSWSDPKVDKVAVQGPNVTVEGGATP